jgi:3-oxoacyl-[acyl-carrier-protein] synthase-3
MLHGETPSRFVNEADHATRLLFSDAGSATALEFDAAAPPAFYSLHSDGQGYRGLIIPGGAFRDRKPADPRDLDLTMDGGAIFNFTVKRVPEVIRAALAHAELEIANIDQFIFHQSNRFIMKHIAKKCGLPEARVPMTLEGFGNSGGPSVAVTLTQTQACAVATDRTLMLLGYGVGLSWASAIVKVAPSARFMHRLYSNSIERH